MRPLRDADLRPPSEVGRAAGLAYSLWLPAEGARAGVIVLHGAGSVKESHHDFARALQGAGLAALCFDQRGHGESSSPMGGEPLEDIAAMADVLRRALGDGEAPLGLRGSSMGGYFALVAAGIVDARAVVAICPASASGLRRGLLAGRFDFAADADALAAFLASHELGPALDALEIPVLLLHAEGDERVPVAHSRELAERLRHPSSRLVTVPGGHHRSVQHDPELQALSVKFLVRALLGDARHRG